MENVRVAIWGFGAMGSGIAEVLLRKKGVDITDVCRKNPKYDGKSIYEVLGVEQGDHKDAYIYADIEKVVYPGAADICVIATDSFTKDVFSKVKYVLENKINVVTIAEEMSYPAAQEPELAAEMDRIAK